MGITAIILFVLVLLLLVTVIMVIQGIRRKRLKKIVFPIVGFVIILLCVYWGFISFITSM